MKAFSYFYLLALALTMLLVTAGARRTNLTRRASPTLQNFLPDHCAEADRVDQAFVNELMLASRAYLADYMGPSFLRYFQPAHAQRVRTVFSRWFFPAGEGEVQG